MYVKKKQLKSLSFGSFAMLTTCGGVPSVRSRSKYRSEHYEIRFFCESSGYFDVRDVFEACRPWLRLHCQCGDLISLPAEMYHRFSPDENMFFHVMRLFSGSPVWTAWGVAPPHDPRAQGSGVT
jgi:1,2-dihydroxy-3-keto-5-methylthiopentene dioxygenase